MPNYVLTYSGGDGMPETEAEQAETMAAWGAWYGQLGAAVVDGGAPTGARSTISPDGSVADGGNITGYTIVSADDLAAAIEMGKGCPVLTSGGTVEVGETIDMG